MPFSNTGSIGIKGLSFYLDGELEVETDALSILVPCDMDINYIKVEVDGAPTDASLILDLHKNGTTIYSTQGNRPTITTGNTSVEPSLPDITALSKGDKLTLEVDQIGSTDPGENLSLIIVGDI